MTPSLGRAVRTLAVSCYEIRGGVARIKRPSSLSAKRRNRAGLRKFAERADLLICFVVIPIGIFVGSRWGIKPVTISLVSLTAVFAIACKRALRN
jgi:hypothetical protein